MIIKRSEFNQPDRLITKPGQLEYEMFSTLFHQADLTGKYTAEIVKHTWLNHLLRAEAEIESLFQYGCRLSTKRLESACRRAVFYKQISSKMIKTILIQRLDLLPLAKSTDIWGWSFASSLRAQATGDRICCYFE